jgi:multiple sugar transport system permease protein
VIQGRRGAAWTLACLAPWIVSFAVFGAYPLLFSLRLSFERYNPLNAAARTFVGLDNYLAAFRDPVFFEALRNTLFFAAGTLPVTTGLALLLALLLERRFPFRDGIRAGFFFPSIVSAVVISVLFKQIYAPFGALNAGLAALHLPTPHWLEEPGLALPCIMVMDIWSSVGYYAVLFLAALQAVPKEIRESAALEGASQFRIFTGILLPQLRPMVLFVVVINTIRSLQIFTEVFVMTAGGPLHATTTAVYHLYDVAFFRFEHGYASALAYLLTGLILVFSLAQAKALRFGEDAGA